MTAPTTPSPERQPADAGGELLPCPFCGTEPAVNRTERAITVGCDFNECPARECYSAGRVEEETDVIAAWNRRAPAPQAQPDARAVEALRAANEALALVTAFESDARYIMGNTNFAILQQRREQVKQALQALSAPAADDGWRPSREEVAAIISGAPFPSKRAFAKADAILALHPAAPTDEVGKS